MSKDNNPPPANHVEWGDWTVDDTDTARDILNYLGIGDDSSREPGADRRRDKIAGMIRARIDAATSPPPQPKTVCPPTPNTTSKQTEEQSTSSAVLD